MSDEAHQVPEAEALPMGERDCAAVIRWWQGQAHEAAVRAEALPSREALAVALHSEGIGCQIAHGESCADLPLHHMGDAMRIRAALDRQRP